MSSLFRHLIGILFGAIYLGTAVTARLHALDVGANGQQLAAMVIYGMGPLCSAIGIYLLYQFSLATTDRFTGRFSPKSLRAIRWAGVAFAATAFLKTIEQALLFKVSGLKDTGLPGFDSSEMFLFLVIGLAFIALSNAGKYLLRNTTQMSNDLNEIV